MEDLCYDVVLCYINEDWNDVKPIANYLADSEKIKVWVDKWRSIPGESVADRRIRGQRQTGKTSLVIRVYASVNWSTRKCVLLL